MSDTKVTAQQSAAENSRTISVEYDFGGTLDGAVEKFGEETVYNNYVAQGKINLQAYLRRLMTPKEGEEPLSDEAIQAKVDEWQPGSKVVQRKTPAEKISAILSGMTAEQKQALLSQLTKSE